MDVSKQQNSHQIFLFPFIFTFSFSLFQQNDIVYLKKNYTIMFQNHYKLTKKTITTTKLVDTFFVLFGSYIVGFILIFFSFIDLPRINNIVMFYK